MGAFAAFPKGAWQHARRGAASGRPFAAMARRRLPGVVTSGRRLGSFAGVRGLSRCDRVPASAWGASGRVMEIAGRWDVRLMRNGCVEANAGAFAGEGLSASLRMSPDGRSSGKRLIARTSMGCSWRTPFTGRCTPLTDPGQRAMGAGAASAGSSARPVSPTGRWGPGSSGTREGLPGIRGRAAGRTDPRLGIAASSPDPSPRPAP